MSELKPCPFCGESKLLYSGGCGFRYDDDDNQIRLFRVHCRTCKGRTGVFESLDEAVEAWNRRTNSTTIQPSALGTNLAEVGTDLISRQVAISAICNACGKIDCDQVDKCEKLFTTQEAAVKQGEIRPGDEVDRYVDGRHDGRAMFLAEDNDSWRCLFWTGCGYTTLSYPKSQFKRTGRHYEIEPILEGIRNES